MNLSDYIHTIPDFPTPGIAFKDISPLLANPDVFVYTINEMAKKCTDTDLIVGLDARGFIFGAAVAFALHKPFVMVRKKGKLPGEIVSMDYDLEYGSNTICIQKNSIHQGQNVAIIDDVLATGGTAQATCRLIEQCGGVINSLVFLMELEFLAGRKKLAGYKVSSMIAF
ncbi:MAG: adenine phosphoribosyltransferase [Candidatus Absconditabacterales bacterium]|nr:adenine phosphoribosyltransferase [Candidatus Absconditabacterales bacterium]